LKFKDFGIIFYLSLKQYLCCNIFKGKSPANSINRLILLHAKSRNPQTPNFQKLKNKKMGGKLF